MERYILSPNLPQGRVVLAIIGARYADLLAKPLKNLGIDSILLPDNPRVDKRLGGHADLSVCHIGGSSIIVSKYLPEFNISKNILLNSSDEQSPEYPQDVGLNAAIIGKKVFHRADCTDTRLKEELSNRGYELINVRQAYTKCSVCVIDDTHIITQDKKIAETAEINGIASLLIENGSIELKGYDTGFIGGSAFKTDRQTVAFTGTLEKHPDEVRIKSFIENCGCRMIYLTDRSCFDVGSIIPLKEVV